MLVSLGFNAAPLPQPDDVLGLMLQCHERIRRFCALSSQLARPAGVPPEQLADAAQRVAHYFSVGLARHAADEDLSLLPRLLAAGVSAEEERALREMAEQHQDIERAVGTLMPLWTAVREAPQRAGEVAGALGPASGDFGRFMEAHLELEERLIFPAARRRLPAAQLAALRAEFRERRPV